VDGSISGKSFKASGKKNSIKGITINKATGTNLKISVVALTNNLLSLLVTKDPLNILRMIEKAVLISLLKERRNHKIKINQNERRKES